MDKQSQKGSAVTKNYSA